MKLRMHHERGGENDRRGGIFGYRCHHEIERIHGGLGIRTTAHLQLARGTTLFLDKPSDSQQS